MTNLINDVINNVKSVCNLSGYVNSIGNGFAVRYVVDEKLNQGWVDSIKNTLMNRIKQTMNVEPTNELDESLEFDVDGKTYVFSSSDFVLGEERVLSITGMMFEKKARV